MLKQIAQVNPCGTHIVNPSVIKRVSIEWLNLLPEKQKKSDTLLPSWWRVKPAWGDGSGSSPRRCCKKKEKKKRDPNFPVKFESNDATLICDLVTKKTRWQGRCQVLHCSACPRRFLTPSYGCLSLCHVDDNEQVLPTHCISPHHLPCYLPFYYQALLALCLRRRGAPGRSAWEERLQILEKRNK